jgi:ribosomal protein L32
MAKKKSCPDCGAELENEVCPECGWGREAESTEGVTSNEDEEEETDEEEEEF